MTAWKEVPNLPAYEYCDAEATYGGTIVRVRTKGSEPVLYAARHVRTRGVPKWPDIATAVDACVKVLEAAK